MSAPEQNVHKQVAALSEQQQISIPEWLLAEVGRLHLETVHLRRLLAEAGEEQPNEE